MTLPALRIENLSVSYANGPNATEVLRNVDLSIEPGEAYGLVGESGSGKTTLALAAMGHLSAAGHVSSGRIELAGRNLLELSEAEMRNVWRERVKLVPQDPSTSLNPRLKVSRQLAEGIELPAQPRRKRILELLESVGLEDATRVANSYPHQLSGGMQQRVMIAMALAGEPELLILDEPTTNLDVTTEARILDLVRELVLASNTAVLYVSHSLGVVAQFCDRVAVLYAGELVEDAPVADLYRQPLHPYTRGLLDSLPRVGQEKRSRRLLPIEGDFPDPDRLPGGCVFAPRCPIATDFTRENRPPLEEVGSGRRVRCHRWREIAEGTVSPRRSVSAGLVAEAPTSGGDDVLAVRDLVKRFPLKRTPLDVISGRRARAVTALDGADLGIGRQRTVGLVGESGSGKSTLARCIAGLVSPTSGSVELFGRPLPATLAGRDERELRSLQMVFQSADEALNPYRTVGSILRRPLRRLGHVSAADVEERITKLLEAVKLAPDYASRLPGQLSGGEKQRVAIARAFASDPELLLFDESLSGLDVSVQAAILNLLDQLQLERNTAYLFISHDLAVVGYLADEIAVIYRGRLMESGPKAAVLEPPYHPYTEALLSAVPPPDPRARRDPIRLRGESDAEATSGAGCPFHARCPRFLGEVCLTREPPWQEGSGGNRIYCHIPLEQLERAQARDVNANRESARHEVEPGD